jgi:hypothetical protein
MRAHCFLVIAIWMATIASPAAAQSVPQSVKPQEAAARSLAAMADCTVRNEASLAAEWLAAADGNAPPGRLQRALAGCLGSGQRAAEVRAGNAVMKGVLAAAFVRRPELVPAGLAFAPLPSAPTADFDIVVSVSSCIAAADAAAARRFADAVSGLPEEQAAFAAIDAQAARCAAAFPDVAINGPMLRAGLNIALFRSLVAARPQA